MRTIKRTFEIPEQYKFRDKLAELVRAIRDNGYQIRPTQDPSRVVANGTYTIYARFPGAEDFSGDEGWDFVGRISGKRRTIVTRGCSRLDEFLEQYKF